MNNTKEKNSRPGIHRAWFVLLGCLMVQSATNGIINNVGQFYAPLAEIYSTPENPVGISDVALGRTLQMIVAALCVYFIGRKILEKYYKPSLLVCSLIYSGQYFLMAFTNNLYQTYVIQAIAGTSLSILQMLCVMTTINRWFYKSRGLAISISTSGAGLCSIIVSPIVGNIIEHFGWRYGFVFFGVLTLVLTLAGTMIFMQKKPEDFGLKPYGLESCEQMQTEPEKSGSDNPPMPSAEHKSIFRRPELYILIFVQSSFQFLMTSTAHTSSYAASIGFGVVAAAYISSIGLAGNTSMKLFVGILRDKTGITIAGITEIILAMTGYLLLIFNPDTVRLYIGVFLVGSVMSTATVVGPVLMGDHFKGDDFLRAYPFTTMIGAFIGAFANYFYGWIRDVSGSYSPIFVMCVVILAADAAAMLVLNKIYKSHT